MTTLYIAGPMSGLPDSNYPAFDAAERELRTAGFDVVNPTSAEAENTTGEWYMRRALLLLLAADGVAMLTGWANSPTATIEIELARQIGMPTMFVDVWCRA